MSEELNILTDEQAKDRMDQGLPLYAVRWNKYTAQFTSLTDQPRWVAPFPVESQSHLSYLLSHPKGSRFLYESRKKAVAHFRTLKGPKDVCSD